MNQLAYKRRTRLRKQKVLLVQSAVAMSTTNRNQANRYNNRVIFDTDSYPIGIDNRCSGCISHKIEDFVGPLVDSARTIKGFGGSRTTNVKIGTLRWTWCDNDGTPHRFETPKSYYVPDGNVRLLSPQHWAKTQKDKLGTGSETLQHQVTLFLKNF